MSSAQQNDSLRSLYYVMEEAGFTPITLADRDTITTYTLRGRSRMCDLAFSNLYGWSIKYGTSWAIIAESLVIGFWPQHRQHPAFLMPICDNQEQLKQTIDELKTIADKGGYPLTLMGVTPECREHLDTYCPDAFHYISDDGTRDYIYLRERLSTLSGKSLQSKRNHINKFEKLYPTYTYEEINRGNIAECLELASIWLANSGEENGRRDERTMIERIFSVWDSLGLMGGAIRVDGKIIAFSYGSPINADTFGIHVEKADIAYEGAFTIMNREFVRRIPEHYTYVNREEDLGLEGLRKSKLSYKPEIILAKDAAVLRYECRGK